MSPSNRVFGTTSPGALLTVGVTPLSWLGGGTPAAVITGANQTVGNAAILRVLSNDSQAADIGGSIALGGYSHSNTNSIQFAEIAGRKENGTSGDVAGYLQFVTTQASGGTRAERMRISSVGAIRFNAYGAGTLVTDASGNITASSDERMKDVIGITSTGLAEVLQMQGKTWNWNENSGMETEGTYEGFIAQDIEPLIPNAVGENSEGIKSLAYHSLLPTFANAIKELNTKVDEKDAEINGLKQRISALENK